MKILAGKEISIGMGPSVVKFKAPEDYECERKDDNWVIIALASLPECKIHLDVVEYNQELFGNYYNRDINMPNGRFRTLRAEIRSEARFGFDPDDRFGTYLRINPDIGWCRLQWRDAKNKGMDVWLHQLDGYMFRLMAGVLKDEESSHIRSIIENMEIEI